MKFIVNPNFANYTISWKAKDIKLIAKIFRQISYIEFVDNDNIGMYMYINKDSRKTITNL